MTTKIDKINKRGAFSFGVYEYTKLQRQNEEISFSDLSVGQTLVIISTIIPVCVITIAGSLKYKIRKKNF